MTTAYVSEIFPTIQGEGPYAGEKQVFLRLAGCPLRCDYCDTPASLTVQGHDQWDASDVETRIMDLCLRQNISTVSVTGGEPLAHVGFLKVLLPRLKERGLRIYLETAGIHPDALSDVVASCDVIAMDIKLPSATGKIFWKEHRAFLAIGGEKIFTKVVIENKSPVAEIMQAIDLLAEQQKPPLLVLQPVTPQADAIIPPSADEMSKIFDIAKARLPRVFVMPQQHPIWGIK